MKNIFNLMLCCVPFFLFWEEVIFHLRRYTKIIDSNFSNRFPYMEAPKTAEIKNKEMHEFFKENINDSSKRFLLAVWNLFTKGIIWWCALILVPGYSEDILMPLIFASLIVILLGGMYDCVFCGKIKISFYAVNYRNIKMNPILKIWAKPWDLSKISFWGSLCIVFLIISKVWVVCAPYFSDIYVKIMSHIVSYLLQFA